MGSESFLVSQGANLNIIPAKGFGGTHPEASNDTPQAWVSALQRCQRNSIVVSGGLPITAGVHMPPGQKVSLMEARAAQ